MNLIEKIKWFFWPVEQKEQKQTILMIIVLFLVSFVYSILRTLKITILLADPTLPSQALSYLKIFGIMPAAIVFTWFAIKIQTTVGQRKTFFIMNAVFALIFSILTFCVLPYQEAFHLHFSGQHELISLLNSWYITIFYVAAEMWSSIMLNMLCWGVIIEITGHKDSPRLYSIFSLAANLATYAAGWWGSSTIKAQVKYFMNTNNPTWDQSLLYQMIVLLICQALIMVFFHVAISSQSDRHQKTLSKKVRLGLKECFSIAYTNPIVRYISMMMISFNIIYHLSDVIHSDYVRNVFTGDPVAMNAYLNCVGKYLGIYAVIFSWVLSGSFVRRFGIGPSLLFTPVLWFILSILDLLSQLSILPVVPVTWYGHIVPMYLLSFSLILSVGRAAKFTVFDTAKEMSLLPLSLEEKRLGKASIDGLTSRLGKTGGAWLVIILLQQLGSLAAALMPLKIAMMLAYGLWFWSVFRLITVLKVYGHEEKEAFNGAMAAA